MGEFPPLPSLLSLNPRSQYQGSVLKISGCRMFQSTIGFRYCGPELDQARGVWVLGERNALGRDEWRESLISLFPSLLRKE